MQATVLPARRWATPMAKRSLRLWKGNELRARGIGDYDFWLGLGLGLLASGSAACPSWTLRHRIISSAGPLSSSSPAPDLPKPQFNSALAAEIRAAGEAVRSPTTSISAASAASAWRRAIVAMAGFWMGCCAPFLGIGRRRAGAFVFCGDLRAMA